MLHYVQIDGRVFGPYAPAQLTAFLKPDMPVSIDTSGPWRPASDVAELADVLAGKVSLALEWYVRKGGEVRGPMAQVALAAMVRRGEILPADAVRHAEWAEFIPLGQTGLFAGLGERRASVEQPGARIVFTSKAPAFSLRHHLRERTRADWCIMLAALAILFVIGLWAWQQSAESRAIIWQNLFPPAAEGSDDGIRPES